MSKTLTKLQERIVARVLAEPAQTLYLREGHVNSTRNMIEKGLIDRHCYMMLQSAHLTPEVKSIFFQENGDVFAIEDIYDNCWIIFEDRKVIAKPRSEANANRIVQALKALRAQSPEPMCGSCGEPWPGKPCSPKRGEVCYPSAAEGTGAAA